MTRLNKLTDVTYRNELYEQLMLPSVQSYLYSNSAYIDNSRLIDCRDEYIRKHSHLTYKYTLDAHLMPDDTVTVIMSQTNTNKSDFTDFTLLDSACEILTTVRSTECPICSIFVNDDIITIRKFCHRLCVNHLNVKTDDIISVISNIFKRFDIIDKGTDIVTLIPSEESSTDK